MTDVAQAVLVPRLDGRFDVSALLSALLTWDRVLVPTSEAFRELPDLVQEIIDFFAPHEALAVIELPPAPKPDHYIRTDVVDELLARFEPADPRKLAFIAGVLSAVAQTGKRHGHAMGSALELCPAIHAAPLTSGRASFVAASAPPERSGGAVRSGRLISAAVTSVAVPEDTSWEAMLSFRERTVALRGRFRAALGDLADSLALDASPAAALEEARATVANRVEPAVADLERALSEHRITYLWRTLTAGAAVASAPVAPSVAVSGAATFVTHSLAYAFNRQRLINEHPLGYLPQLRRAFGSRPVPSPNHLAALTIRDPAAETKDLWARVAAAALASVSDADFDRDRSDFERRFGAAYRLTWSVVEGEV